MLGKGIFAAILLIVAVFAMAMPVSAVKTETLTTGQETGFWVWGGETVEVYYSPNQQGNKMFSTWHQSFYNFCCEDGLTKVNFYWKDNSKPNDQWHSWRSAAVGYYPLIPKTTQNLYSGSSSICYKFVYQTYSNGIYVYAKVQ